MHCLYAKAEEAAIAGLKRALGALNTHLASTTYLVGNAVTLADIVLTCVLHSGFTKILTKGFTSEFPHVERYFWTMINQPNVSKVLGEAKQAETVHLLLLQRSQRSQKKLPIPRRHQRKKPRRKLRSQKQTLLKKRVRHRSPSQRILLICFPQVRWCCMTGRGFTLIPRPTSVRLPLKVSGTCMIPKDDTLCGLVITSTRKRTRSHS